jgi:hypothetical protein
MTAVTMPVRLIRARRRLVVVGAVIGGDQRIADMAGRRLTGAVVAARLDPSMQRLHARRVGVIDDRRGLRDRIGLDRNHTRTTGQHPFNHRLLRGVIQPPTCSTADSGAAVEDLNVAASQPAPELARIPA